MARENSSRHTVLLLEQNAIVREPAKRKVTKNGTPRCVEPVNTSYVWKCMYIRHQKHAERLIIAREARENFFGGISGQTGNPPPAVKVWGGGKPPHFGGAKENLV